MKDNKYRFTLILEVQGKDRIEALKHIKSRLDSMSKHPHPESWGEIELVELKVINTHD